MQSSNYSKSALAVGALFVLGDAVMYLPSKLSGENTLLGLLIAIVLGAILYLAVIPIYTFTLKDGKSAIYQRIIKYTVLSVLAIGSAFAVAECFKNFTQFVSKIILPDTPLWLISAIFTICILYIALKKQQAFLKFSLICFLFTAIAIIFFFLASVSDYQLENINIMKFPKLPELFYETKPYLLNPVIPSLLLPFYYSTVFGENKASGNWGALIGIILLGVCILSAVLLFGTPLACRLSNPYASAVSTISIGRLYTRLDGFSYFIYFVTSLVKINSCIFIVSSCLKRLGGKA